MSNRPAPDVAMRGSNVAARSGMRVQLARSADRWLYPSLGILALLALWQALAASGRVAGYLLPAPDKVLAAFVRIATDGTLVAHIGPTLSGSALGWMFGSLAAIALAALVAEFKWVERALLVHLIAIQSIPKVSIAPLVFLWLGFGLEGRVLLVALICFFPVFANALSGFRSIDPSMLDLMRASGASRWHTWLHVKLPGSASALFAGLEVSVAFALIGCVVMEFIGASSGLGFLIQDASNTFDLPLSFAAVLVLGFIGLTANALVRRARRALLPWDASSIPTEPHRA